jgi:predicted nuclease of restriction endonuclease-like (RecB) superfamily
VETDLTRPAGYATLLTQLKARVAQAQVQARRAANTELLTLYWDLGDAIRQRQDAEGWGARTITRLSEDLRTEFPAMRGLSRPNLYKMRAFAAAWTRDEVVSQAVRQLPWGHVVLILTKFDDRAERDWYAAAAAEHGWSRNVLQHQIMSRAHARLGTAPSNFSAALPAPHSELAQQIAKDPYVFDFLELGEQVAERDLEQALMDRLVQTLREFGAGFAFVDRQVRFDVDGDEYVLDLLLFHVEQLRYVVVELKVGAFKPEYTGQLGFYVALVDDRRRREQHNRTVGILLCAGRNETTVRYALQSTAAPMAVATFTYDELPGEERAALPPEGVVARALAHAVTGTPAS